MQLSAVESVVAERDSALPQKQGTVARLAGERVCAARAAEVHGGAVLRSFLKLHDERIVPAHEGQEGVSSP